MRLLLLSALLTLSACISSADFFHDKVGMGKDKSQFAQYLEVELINHVDSIGRGSEDPKCNLKNNCKFYYGRGTPGNSFDNQGLNVKTDSQDIVQDIYWWFKINMNLISMQLDNIKSFPTAMERFKDSEPDYILELKGDLPVKQFRLFWQKKWGVMKSDVFCYNKEHEQIRNCHVIDYWISYKTPDDYWVKVKNNFKDKNSTRDAKW